MLTALIIVTLFTVFGSAICSLCEATLLSINNVRLETLKREGSKTAKIWLSLKKDIDRPISTILIVNTIANTAGATLAGALFTKLYGEAMVIFYLIGLTLAILYVGEIVPKILGSIYNERLSLFLGRPLFIATRVLSPLIYITELFSKRLRGDAHNSSMSATDIEVLAQLAKSRNLIADEQEEIIVGALNLRKYKVKDNMIPRQWIVFLRLDLDNVANFRIGQHAMHTRYPVSYNESPDKIMGYINYKDLIGFRPHGEDLNLEAFIRPILSLPVDMDLNTALRTLSAKRHHIALVKDKEKDEVVGLITMEDIIEELVGDIEDEFDMSSAAIIPVTDKIWRVGASITMDKISHIIGHELEEVHENKTLGHWLDEKVGRKKFPGANYEKDQTRFTVQQARQGKVFQVIIEKLNENGVEEEINPPNL